jgi:KipI family sensor histidine kinase inhibitor
MGDRCLMVEFGDRVDPYINSAARAFAERLLEQPVAGITDVVPAFTSVAVHYRPEVVQGPAEHPPYRRLQQMLESVLADTSPSDAGEQRLIDIPVCYGGELGPDLATVAATCNMSEQQVIDLHSAGSHLVYMLGFAPGSPYIGGLDPRLALPRRSTPRTRVPAGTVAIAREQSAIYSIEMPGGWNLLGRTPLKLFSLQDDPPCLLRPGDRVRFVPISTARYDALLGRQP